MASAAGAAGHTTLLQKIGAPSIGEGVDAAAHWKLAQRVDQTMQKCINSEPKQIPPGHLLVAPANRDGAPPNIQYVHQGILRSLGKAGFDRTRPQTGICVQFKSTEAKKRLLEYNKTFTLGNPLYPPIDEAKVLYGTLAGSHLNLALRIIQSGLPSPATDVSKLAPAGSPLGEVVESGHKWYILPEETPVDQQVEVSLWRNMDQNENQGLHEIEVLRSVISCCAEVSKVRSNLSVADIVARVAHKSPMKTSNLAVHGITKFYLRLLEDKMPELAVELQDFHSSRVNPRELQMSANFFSTLADTRELRGHPLLRHYLLTTAYTPEKARSHIGSAETANFIETSAVAGLVKKPAYPDLLEKLLEGARTSYLPILAKELTAVQARLELVDLADLLLRSALGKPFKANSSGKGVSGGGGMTEAKARQLSIAWASGVDQRYPDLQFTLQANLQPDLSVTPRCGDQESNLTVNISGLLNEGKELSGELETNQEGEFQTGEEVSLIRRISAIIPLEHKANYRKDIDRGTIGVFQEYVDEGKKQGLVQFKVKVPSDSGASCVRDITTKVSIRNITRPSPEEENETAGPAPRTGGPGESAGSDLPIGGAPETAAASDAAELPEEFSFVNAHLEESQRTEVRLEEDWTVLEDRTSDNQSLFFLRGHAAALSAAAIRGLPEYGKEDLLVLHRKISGKLAWRTEVWTLRKFKACELMLPVFSTEIKDKYYTNLLHAFLSLPQHGPSRHPEGKQLAFDGRGRSRMVSAGSGVQPAEVRGLLCWTIERDSGESANLDLAQVPCEMTVNLSTPGAGPSKKRKLSVAFNDKELPEIPIIYNPKAIQANTKLCLRGQ